MDMDYEIWGTEGDSEDQRGRAEVQGFSCVEAAGVERVYSWQRLSVWTAPGEEPSSDSSTHLWRFTRTHNLALGDPMPSSGLTSSYTHGCACPHTETRLHTSLKI